MSMDLDQTDMASSVLEPIFVDLPVATAADVFTDSLTFSTSSQTFTLEEDLVITATDLDLPSMSLMDTRSSGRNPRNPVAISMTKLSH